MPTGASMALMWHSVMPCGLYGIGDNFDPTSAHVVAATLRRFGDAVAQGRESVQVWGSGRQRRQLLFADDLAAACTLLLAGGGPSLHGQHRARGRHEHRGHCPSSPHAWSGFHGSIQFDPSKPEGVLRRELDTSFIHSLGWQPTTELSDGLEATWRWYQEKHSQPPLLRRSTSVTESSSPIRYSLSQSSWDEAEVAALHRVIDSGQFTMAHETRAYEEAFARYLDTPFCVAVNSGSTANLLMVAALMYRRVAPCDPATR